MSQPVSQDPSSLRGITAPFRRRFGIFMGMGIGLMMPWSSWAATVTWDGSTDGNWGDDTNWDSEPSLPASTDAVIFDAANDGGNATLSLGADRSVLSLEFVTGGTNGFTFSSGNALTVGASGILNSNSQAQTFDAELRTSGNQTWTNTSAGDLDFNDVRLASNLTLTGDTMSIGGALTNYASNRTLTNDLTGSLTIDSINLSNNTSNRRLSILGSGDTIVTGVISGASGAAGAGRLTKNGTGDLTLSASANTYTGQTVLQGSGTTFMGNDASFGTGELLLNGGTLDDGGAARTIANATRLSNNSTLTGSDGIEFTNTFTLSNNRTLTVNNSGSNVINAVELSNSATARRFTVGGTEDLTIDGVISDGAAVSGGRMRKIGTGTLTLTQANTYTGDTNLGGGGTVIAGHEDAFGTGRLDLGTTTLQSNAGALDFDNTSQLVGSLRLGGTDDLTFSGDMTLTGNRSLYADGTGDYEISGNVALSNNATNRTLTLRGTGDLEISGDISDGGTATASRLTKTDAGTLTLSGDNSYGGITDMNVGTLIITGNNSTTGNFQADGGIVEIGHDNAFGTSTILMKNADFRSDNDIRSISNAITLVGSGTDFTGSNDLTFTGLTTLSGSNRVLGFDGTGLTTFGAIALSSSASNRTLTINGTGDATIAGNITNGGTATASRLTMSGAGTLTLDGNNSYGGTTNMNSGSLIINGTNSTTGLFRLDGGTVTVGNNSAFGTGDIRLATGTFQGDGTARTIANDTLLYGSAVTMAGTSDLTFTGTMTLNGNRTLTVTNTGTTTLGDIALSTNTNNRTLTLDNDTGADVVIDGVISNAGSSASNLTKNSAGTLTLTGENTFTGTTTINAGTLNIGDGGTSGSLTGNLVNKSAVVFNRSNDSTYGGVLSNSGTVEKTGSGNLTFSGANTYTGATTVSDGTLTLAHANALGTAAAGTTVDSGATLALTNGITVASEAVTNNGTVTNTSGTNTFGGVISGTGVLTTASGNLTLSNTNTYSGDTTVGNGSTLTLSADNALGTGSTTVDSGGTLALTGDITAAQTNFDLSGTGNSTAGAIQNVSGDNRLTGDFSLSAATTTQSDAGTLILGADPPSEDYATDTFDIGANALTIAGTGDTELNAGLSGSGNLVKDGTGTLTVVGVVDKTGTTAFTGEVTVNDGTLVQATLFNVAPGTVGYDDYGINNDITVGNGDATAATLTLGTNDAGSGTNFAHMIAGGVDLTVNSDGTFNTRGHATVLEDVTLDNGTINANKLAGGNEDALVIKGSISATNTSGDSTINGVIDFNQPGNPPASLTTVDVASGGTLDINARVQNGGISKTGDGTLELSGVNTYSGATNVTAGILRVDQGTVGSNSGLGNEDGGTVVSSGAQLQLDDVTISGEALTLNGTGISGDGALQTVASTTNTWGGTVAIASTSEIEVSSGSSLTLSGVMSGSGQTLTIDGPGTSEISGEITSLSILNKTGSGQLTLSGDSKTIATTNVSEGTLTLGTSNILSDALDLNLSGTGTFTMGVGITETIDQLTVAGSSVLDVHDVLTLNGGTISGGDGSGSTGTMILSSGTVMTPNKLNITNDFDFGGTLELTADTVLAISGGHTFDLGTLNVTGDTVIDFTGADPNTFNLGTLNIAVGVTIDVIGWDSHFDLWTAANFIGASLDNRNAVSAQITFNGFSPAHTIWLTEDFGDFEITVPEPGTYGAVLMGMSLATWLLRRPRRHTGRTHA